MESINYLDEIEGKILLDNRHSSYEKGVIVGLGPDDLVVVAKSLITKNESPPIYFCHCTIGIFIESPDSFMEYYRKLEEHQEKENKKKSTNNYKILGAQYRCYNSFSNEEFIININEEEKVESNIGKLTDQNFRHFQLSSTLRYYRATFPLFHSIIGGFPQNYHYVNIIKPPKLTLKDLLYITKHHSISNELQYSIASIIPIMIEPKSFSEYLHKYEHKIPLIMSYIHQVLPKNREISTALYFFLEHHLDFFCDDLSCAIIVSNHYCNRKKIDRCTTFVPLLRSNLWSNPSCAICLGRICTATQKYRDALGYFNIASISSGWPPNPPLFDNLSKEELRLCRTPLIGVYSDYIDAVLELYLTVGNDEFSDLLIEFSRKHVPEKIDPKYEEPLEYCPDSIACGELNEIFLFDPGIQSEPSIKNELLDTPYSSGFQDLIKVVRSIFTQYNKLRLKTAQLAQDHVGNLIVAYRMRDSEMMTKIFKIIMQARTVTIADYFVMLKGMMVGILLPSDEVLKTYPYNVSISHRITLDYTRNLIEELINLPLLADNLW